MTRVEESSQKVEQKQHAQANNSEVSLVALIAKGVFESCQKQKTKPHALSKTVAEQTNGKQKLGWAGAVVLRYLCHMLRVRGKEHEGVKHVRVNLDHIKEQYPFLGRSGVDNAISRLKSFGACSIRNLNVEFGRSKIDRTRWYCVPKQWMDLAEIELRYFYPPLAAVVGVPAAVIHYNFTHWIDELTVLEEGKDAEDRKPVVFALFPETLVKLQAFSDSTVKRVIKTLVDEKLIIPVFGKQCVYSPVPQITSRSKVDMVRSEVNMPRSKVDRLVSKVDDNIYCSLVIVPFVEGSKTQPAVASENSFPCQETDNDISKSLEHIESLSPFATLFMIPASEPKNPLPAISSYEDCHKLNQTIREVVSVIEQDKKAEDALIQKAWEVTDAFFRTLGHTRVDELYEDANDSELSEALFPLYRDWFPEQPESSLFSILYYGVFECVLDAFFEKTQAGRHPLPCFRRISYHCHLNIIRRMDAHNEEAIQREQRELKEQHASIDANKEWDASLSPAEKARVFKQVLYSRNKVGWICLGGERLTDQITIKPKALKDVERLFSMNPDACSGHLLLVMDECMKLHSSYPPVGKFKKGHRWHARMGRKLNMFTRHLKTISAQLRLLGVLPFRHFLNEDIEDEALLKSDSELEKAA